MHRRHFLVSSAAAALAPVSAQNAGRGYRNDESSRETLPRTYAVLERGIQEGLHLGVQGFVSRNAKQVAHITLGESRPGVPMTSDTITIWYSNSKVIGAVCIARLWEQGKLDLDDRVVQYIPEFGVNGKDVITYRHILTHTAGFRAGDAGVEYLPDWDRVIQQICASKLEPGWVPGLKAVYHPTASWYILGETIRRIDGRPYREYVREEIFKPLGMKDSWVGMPREKAQAYGNRIGAIYLTQGQKPQPATPLDKLEDFCAISSPGATAVGPIRELGRFYEMLLMHGSMGGANILSPQTVEAISANHRIDMFDETFKIVIPWGLGFIKDMVIFGGYSSTRTFGHGGGNSSATFCDPEHGVVAAILCNGHPGWPRHSARFYEICNALYLDLGIATPAATPRPKPIPLIIRA